MRKFYVLAPAGIQSGGPELCHQMVSTLNELGEFAKIFYADGVSVNPVDCNPVNDYKKYNTSHVRNTSELEKELSQDSTESIWIVNEGMTPYLPVVPAKLKVLWWMSVDNYFKQDNRLNKDEIFSSVAYHLVQSEYAKQFLIKEWGISESKILYLSDYISEEYGQFIYPANLRKNIALYNPYKGYEDLKPLIQRTSDYLEWLPLVNKTREEVIFCLEIGKLYVDFGNHPGKDRIPREAAACGCCVITNKKGSAAFFEDVSIPEKYKFETPAASLDKIDFLIRNILTDFSTHQDDFREYRDKISNEKAIFRKEVSEFVHLIAQKG